MRLKNLISLRVKMEKTSIGGIGMKNMVKTGIGLDLRSEKISNPIVFTNPVHIIFVFTTNQKLVNMY